MNEPNRRPWEKVTDPSYFKGVLRTVVGLGYGPRRAEQALIRFGATGDGYAPNYQIEAPNAEKRCFNGRSHKEVSISEEEFAPKNLSEEQFTYLDVEQMLARVRGNKR